MPILAQVYDRYTLSGLYSAMRATGQTSLDSWSPSMGKSLPMPATAGWRACASPGRGEAKLLEVKATSPETVAGAYPQATPIFKRL